MGWPLSLVETTTIGDNEVLSLRERAGEADRQWKGVMSWMLGIVGTRRFLAHAEYHWIAPVSAFYPEAVHAVALPPDWPPEFPRSRVKIEAVENSPVRLRPDYLAVRNADPHRGGAPYELAIAESKGTRACLTQMVDCPLAWREQVNNAIVSIDENVIDIPRHIVVATRVNPNAKRPATRRMQVRAWNSARTRGTRGTLPEVATSIAAAYLFGLFRNLGLRENARAICFAVAFQSAEVLGSEPEPAAVEVFERARGELSSRTSQNVAPTKSEVVVRIQSDFGEVDVEIAPALIELAIALRRPESWRDGSALKIADAEILRWEKSRTPQEVRRGFRSAAFGVAVRVKRASPP